MISLIHLNYLSALIGSLSNDDGEGNENDKKAMGLDCLNNNFAARSFERFFAVAARLQRDFNQLSYTELIIRLMNSQNFSVNSHLLKFISLCNDLRNNLLSNDADDTWSTIVIIALHYHCFIWFVCLFLCCCFFLMSKLLQYCNYIIIVLQIKLLLWLLPNFTFCRGREHKASASFFFFLNFEIFF